ncbi:MAG: hypothetical protein ACKO6F_02900, partial [Cyanobium sp.]
MPIPLSRSLGALLLAAGLISATGAAPAIAGPAPATGSSTTASLGEALEPSTDEQKLVGEWLRQQGVIFYGAWWCPACFQQKNLFGKEAGNRLPYVECEKEEAGRTKCQGAAVLAYPTWVMGNQRLEGVQNLEQLKRWSG